jgi:hypothetical protein
MEGVSGTCDVVVDTPGSWRDVVLGDVPRSRGGRSRGRAHGLTDSGGGDALRGGRGGGRRRRGRSGRLTGGSASPAARCREGAGAVGGEPGLVELLRLGHEYLVHELGLR